MVKEIAAEKIKAGLRYAVVCPNVAGGTKDRIVQSKPVRTRSLAIIVDEPQVARTCILRAVRKCYVVFLWRYFFVLFRSRLFDFIEARTLCPIVFRYTCAPTATHGYITTVWDPFCFFGSAAFSEYFCSFHFVRCAF